MPTALDQLRGLRRWQKGALAGAVLVPVVLMGQAFVRTALLPGDPGFFSGVEYTDGYEAGWEHAKAFPSRPEGLCSLKAARVPDYETDAESFDWQLGYLKGCHDGRKD